MWVKRATGGPVATQAAGRVAPDLAVVVYRRLQGLHLFNTSTGEKFDLPVKGLFYGIGHQPNSKLVAGQIELDEAGYVKVRMVQPSAGSAAGLHCAGMVVLPGGPDPSAGACSVVLQL